MVKDLKTGEIFRADHLVEAVLESRLKGNQEARGQAAAPPPAEDDKKKKKKKVVKSTAVKLEDEAVKEYEYLLAQVRFSRGLSLGDMYSAIVLARSTITLARNLVTSSRSTTSSTRKPETSCLSPRNLI